MNQMIGSAAIFGVIAGCWGQIKQLGWRVINLFIVNLRVDDDLSTGLLIYVEKNMYRSPYGERYFSSVARYVKPLNRQSTVAYERFNSTESVIFWKGWKPILIQHTPPDSAAGKQAAICASFIRGTWDVDGLIATAMDSYNEMATEAKDDIKRRSKRFFINRFVGSGKKIGQVNIVAVKEKKSTNNSMVYDSGSRFVQWKHSDIGLTPDDGEEVINSLAFPPEIAGLIKEMKHWRASEQWYRSHGVPWRHGWLLYGSPGNGKTSLVRALGIDCDLPIFLFDLASMCNSEFVEAWQNMMKNTPCIALFEDIDGVFNKRENITGDQGGGLTFDCFLNCIGGIEEANGVFVVVTTNKVESIDEALGAPTTEYLSTRPGRLDRAIEVLPPNATCRRKIAEKILSDWPEVIDDIVDEGRGDSGVQFQDRCINKACRLYWQQAEELGLSYEDHTNVDVLIGTTGRAYEQ